MQFRWMRPSYCKNCKQLYLQWQIPLEVPRIVVRLVSPCASYDDGETRIQATYDRSSSSSTYSSSGSVWRVAIIPDSIELRSQEV